MKRRGVKHHNESLNQPINQCCIVKDKVASNISGGSVPCRSFACDKWILLRLLAVQVHPTNPGVGRWYKVVAIYQRNPPISQLGVRWEAMQQKHAATALHFLQAVSCTCVLSATVSRFLWLFNNPPPRSADQATFAP